MTRLQKIYQEQIVGQLKEHFSFSSVMQVPRIEKITLNMGVGEAVNDKKIMDHAVRDMVQIAAQKPIVTKARKSVAGFKIREEWPIGCKVTLRRERMYEFLDRLVNAALPRIRDFRGVSSTCFDGRGNCTIGVKEVEIFPEVDPNKVGTVQGMDITIVTNAQSDDAAQRLLKLMGMPFGKN